MFRNQILIAGVLVAFLLAACGATPTPEAPTEESMAEEAMDEEMAEDEMSEDEMMDDEMMEEDSMDDMAPHLDFTVRIENISDAFEFAGSGVFNTPSEASEPGPLAPGAAYTFDFNAAPGQSLSFATMFVQSNDLFYAPDETGIALYGEDGSPISGDVTDQIALWDVGTEVNQEPGAGADQAPRQAGPDTGEAEDGVVQLVDDGFSYPAVSDNILVSIENTGENQFSARVENISSDESLLLAPGVWVVHTEPGALFTAGEADRGEGLEALAEDGNPAGLGEALTARSGVTVLLAPGVWAIHTEPGVFFTEGEADRGDGLEALAEDGDPSGLADATQDYMGVVSLGVFNTPAGADGPGPLTPGNAYEFVVTASADYYLSLATMLVQSNDLFYAPAESGISLFDENGEAISGDVTDLFLLWDAGTEVNQLPGFGIDQAPRQAGPNTGADEGGSVVLVADGFDYPENVIRITITPIN